MNKQPSPTIVKALLTREGYGVAAVRQISGGSNHLVFVVDTVADGRQIVKFPLVRETDRKYISGNRDTLFGGELSPQREAFLMGHIREKGLPTPLIHGVYPSEYGSFIVMEHAQGCNMMEYLEQHGHHLSDFLAIAASLGSDLRKLHQSQYPSFGNIMEGAVIEPSGIDNFTDRYNPINQRILRVCHDKGGLDDLELTRVSGFFEDRFRAYRSALTSAAHPPRLVITDLHGGNFFVDDNCVSSYFDVESAQSAPAEFEIYGLRFFVFNYYGAQEQALSERAFWTAYNADGRDAPSKQSDELIDFFSACRLLEIFQSYWGVKDGLRDTWGVRIKRILMNYIQNGEVDYLALGNVWRDRDKQPLRASQ